MVKAAGIADNSRKERWQKPAAETPNQAAQLFAVPPVLPVPPHYINISSSHFG